MMYDKEFNNINCTINTAKQELCIKNYNNGHRLICDALAEINDLWRKMTENSKKYKRQTKDLI